MVLPMDVLDFDSHRKLVDQILAKYKRIDILVRVPRWCLGSGSWVVS
jgi:NAD(P)-dependent dehydrogenase (short-subunit alcohol dehydrogenase family)